MNSLDNAYQQSLDYLYSFVDYSLTHNLRFSPEKFDLARMHDLMARLGNPHQKYPVIHVAGTKGKGSTAAMTAAALQAAGYRVGFYTSPHLEDFNERIQVNGQPISRADLVMLVDQLRPHAAAIERITTFELTTALGFMYFAHAQVDVAVVEVGLGGRLDATNVVTPLVSVITSLSYDHMAVLGNTLAQIATEKAGIIKPGRPIVLAPQKEEARLVVDQIAAERSAPLTQVGKDLFFAPWSHSLDGQTLLIWSPADQSLVDEYIESAGHSNWQPIRLTIPLLGHHQIENAATAYMALQAANAAGLPISDAAIQQGLLQTHWPGRFEILRRDPPLVIDSAHNRDSALKLRLAVEDYFPGKRVVLLFGASEDKDIAGMFAELMPRVWQVIATQSVHPRAMPPEQLVALAHQFGVRARVVLPLEAALEQALQIAGPDALVLGTGSIFVAAAIRSAWQKLNTTGRG